MAFVEMILLNKDEYINLKRQKLEHVISHPHAAQKPLTRVLQAENDFATLLQRDDLHDIEKESLVKDQLAKINTFKEQMKDKDVFPQQNQQIALTARSGSTVLPGGENNTLPGSSSSSTSSIKLPQDAWSKMVIDSVPKTHQTRAKGFLSYISTVPERVTWNYDGQLVVRGAVVEGSNICDLIHHAVRDSTKKTPPQSWKTFIDALRETNIPRHSTLGLAGQKALEKVSAGKSAAAAESAARRRKHSESDVDKSDWTSTNWKKV